MGDDWGAPELAGKPPNELRCDYMPDERALLLNRFTIRSRSEIKMEQSWRSMDVTGTDARVSLPPRATGNSDAH
jgi:hypothetical protein